AGTTRRGLCSGGRLQPPRHPGHRDPPRRPDRRRPAQTGLADPVGRDRRQGTAPLLVGPGRYRPRPARLPVAADPPQPPHRRAGVLPLLRPQARPYIDAGQGRRPSLDDRGGLPGRQGPVRPGPAPGPHLEILVPLDHPGHARPRLPDRGGGVRTRPPARRAGPDPPHPRRDPAPHGPADQPPPSTLRALPRLGTLATTPSSPCPHLPLPAAIRPATLKITTYHWSTNRCTPAAQRWQHAHAERQVGALRRSTSPRGGGEGHRHGGAQSDGL